MLNRGGEEMTTNDHETAFGADNSQEESQGRGEFRPETETGMEAVPIRYAGFWMRFWAYLMDLIIIGSLNRLLVFPIFRALGLPLAESEMFAPAAVATAIVFYLYFVLMTKYFGQTLGKMVFGLRVINLKGEKLSWGTVLFREWIGRFISITLVIAYVVVAFLPKKQGLHDLFADTAVVHENP
jgi:uncharacterized RDD family membrane protein YckC